MVNTGHPACSTMQPLNDRIMFRKDSPAWVRNCALPEPDGILGKKGAVSQSYGRQMKTREHRRIHSLRLSDIFL